MKQNMLVTSYDYEVSKRLAEKLAEVFSLRTFDNVVFVANMGFADKHEDLFYKIKLSNFVILLKKDIESELIELKSKHFATKEQQDFFTADRETLLKQEHIIEKECADIVVDITNLEDDEIIEKIIDKIKNYYSVN